MLAPQLYVVAQDKVFRNLDALSSIEHRLNALPRASVQLVFSSMDELDQAGSVLLPGQSIEFRHGEQTLFAGKIAKHSIHYSKAGCLLILECAHPAFALATQPRSRYFTDIPDSRIIEEVLAEHGISADINAPTLHLDSVVQHNLSDWDFVLQRLAANGLVAYCSERAVIAAIPALDTKRGFSLPEQDLISADIAVDATRQVAKLELSAWNPHDQELMQVEAEAVDFPANDRLAATLQLLEQGIYSKRLAGEYSLQELQTLANAQLAQSRLAMIRGKVTATGLYTASPGQALLLEQCGSHLSGQYFIASVTYALSPGAAPVTHFDIGLPLPTDIQETTQGFSGLLIGKVLETDNDPQAAGRIKITAPLIDPHGAGTWARLATLQAGMNSGTVFRPAVGSEVILGLFGANPDDIVVLGACHSSATPAPWENADLHGFQSPGQLKLAFDDEKQRIVISARDGTKLYLSQDAAETFLLEDQQQNKIRFTSDGMHLQSHQLVLESDNLKLKGLNVDVEAKHSLRLKSGTSMEISTSGNLKLKGSLVSIN
ncbi:phage baseplate assembly protein V [Methylobacillus sp. Pita2]|uniref:phage baseplate assembly protein V n=1 Tax=Methylobacillus sp. Pita2 TaxID=3383245 RepID=UPI0038B4CD88